MKIKELRAAVTNNNHPGFKEIAREFTPNQLAHFQAKEGLLDFDYMLWSASSAWGFEVLWASEYLLAEDQRHADVDLPEYEILNPDVPLKNQALWAIGG